MQAKDVANERFQQASATGSSTLPTEQQYTLFTSEERRVVLSHLERTREPITAEDLARVVAATLANKPIAAITDDERQTVHVELFHLHLPKLADHGLVEHDRRSGIVRLPSD